MEEDFLALTVMELDVVAVVVGVEATNVPLVDASAPRAATLAVIASCSDCLTCAWSHSFKLMPAGCPCILVTVEVVVVWVVEEAPALVVVRVDEAALALVVLALVARPAAVTTLTGFDWHVNGDGPPMTSRPPPRCSGLTL